MSDYSDGFIDGIGLFLAFIATWAFAEGLWYGWPLYENTATTEADVLMIALFGVVALLARRL